MGEGVDSISTGAGAAKGPGPNPMVVMGGSDVAITWALLFRGVATIASAARMASVYAPAETERSLFWDGWVRGCERRS